MPTIDELSIVPVNGSKPASRASARPISEPATNPIASVSPSARSAFIASPVVTLHEHELLEQRDVLFVLEQRADERRHRDLVVLALQRGDRDVLGHQQLEPV